MSVTRGKSLEFALAAVVLPAFLLSCTQSFEATSPPPPIDKGGAEIQVTQTERKLRASGCVFEVLPGASRLRDEKLTCTFDPRAQGASAIDDTLAQLARFDAMTKSIQDYLDAPSNSLAPDKREQFDHRLLLLADAKASLKNQLQGLYDDESRMQLAMGAIGATGCQVVGTKLSCEEAIDLVHATDQITALKRLQEALTVLFEGHAPILKVPLQDYRDIASAVAARLERLEDSLRAEADSGGIGIKILGEGAGGLKSAISIDGGLFVSAAQTLQVAQTIDGIAKLITQNGYANDLRSKAYRRVVITPLVSAPTDVDFDSVTRTVFLPDTIKPEDALDFLRKSCAPKDSPKAAEQAEGLAKIDVLSKAMRDSGDLGSTGLVMEASVARRWASAELALRNVRQAIDALTAEGKWGTDEKTQVHLIAGERFASFGEVEVSVVIDAQASAADIAEELRGVLAARTASRAHLSAL